MACHEISIRWHHRTWDLQWSFLSFIDRSMSDANFKLCLIRMDTSSADDILKKALVRMNGEARTSKHRSSIWLPPWLRCKYWSQGGSPGGLHLIFPNVVYRLSWCWVCIEVTVAVKEASGSDACLMHNSAIRSSNGVSITAIYILCRSLLT